MEMTSNFTFTFLLSGHADKVHKSKIHSMTSGSLDASLVSSSRDEAQRAAELMAAAGRKPPY